MNKKFEYNLNVFFLKTFYPKVNFLKLKKILKKTIIKNKKINP